jgi:hypothetical protein
MRRPLLPSLLLVLMQLAHVMECGCGAVIVLE